MAATATYMATIAWQSYHIEMAKVARQPRQDIAINDSMAAIGKARHSNQLIIRIRRNSKTGSMAATTKQGTTTS